MFDNEYISEEEVNKLFINNIDIYGMKDDNNLNTSKIL